MTVGTKHGLYGVVIDTDLVGGITALDVNTGSEVRSEARSGEIYNRIQSLVAQKPGARFSSNAVVTALDLCALAGVDIGGLTNGLILYAQKHADGGGRAGATSHLKYVIKDGILVPRTLSVDHQGDAVLSYEAIVKYDGTNVPVVCTAAQSLPAGIVDTERFTLGPVTLENVAINQIKSLSLDFGITVETEGADSDIWDTFASIKETNPVLTLRGIKPEWFAAAAIPLAGLNGTHANTAIYLRKRLAGGSFVPDATAEHIKFTAAGLITLDSIFDASGNDTGECSLTMPLTYDGTNAPLVIDTTSVLP